MSIQTTISEEDFKQILLNYNLGQYQGFKTFTNGAGQTTVLLLTITGKYVLRYYENRPQKHVLFEVNLFNYLHERKYPVPKVIKNSQGKFHGEYKGKPYIIIEYIEGEHGTNPNDFFDKEKTSKVIEALAKLHTITKEFNSEYFKDREEYNPEYCWRVYKERPNNVKSQERKNWLKKELDALEFPTLLPRGICHADVNYGNFLFKNGEIVAVLDFDMSFYSYLIYDVASLIYWWAWSPETGIKAQEAFFIVNEYSKYRELSELEKRHIYDALKLIILLGISWSEEGDFESNSKIVEQLDEIGREKFYNLLFI